MPRQKNGQVSYHKKQQPVRCQAAEGLWLGFFLVPLGRGGCQTLYSYSKLTIPIYSSPSIGFGHL